MGDRMGPRRVLSADRAVVVGVHRADRGDDKRLRPPRHEVSVRRRRSRGLSDAHRRGFPMVSVVAAGYTRGRHADGEPGGRGDCAAAGGPDQMGTDGARRSSCSDCSGAIWAGVWYVWFRDSPAEKAGSYAVVAPAAGHHFPWRAALRSPSVMALMSVGFCYVYVFNFFQTWFTSPGTGGVDSAKAACCFRRFLLCWRAARTCRAARSAMRWCGAWGARTEDVSSA